MLPPVANGWAFLVLYAGLLLGGMMLHVGTERRIARIEKRLMDILRGEFLAEPEPPGLQRGFDRAMSVPCPACHAEVGEFCCRGRTSLCHVERVERWKAAR